nr:hypothetical protein I308_05642 [Cryptococcus tetragattii IND107]
MMSQQIRRGPFTVIPTLLSWKGVTSSSKSSPTCTNFIPPSYPASGSSGTISLPPPSVWAPLSSKTPSLLLQHLPFLKSNKRSMFIRY